MADHVYIVRAPAPEESRRLVGVYASLESAEKAAEKAMAEWNDKMPGLWGTYSIESCPVEP